MSRTVMPLVWLAAPGWPLPADLPPLADLGPAEGGEARVAALREPVALAEAVQLAGRLARVPGVERAGWVEPDRAVVLGPAGPVAVLRRVRGAWEPIGAPASTATPGGFDPGSRAPGSSTLEIGLPLSPGAAAVLSTARLRLGLTRT